MKKRLPLIAAGAVLVVVAISIRIWSASGRESTDDAQVEAHVTPIAARVGGTVARVPVNYAGGRGRRPPRRARFPPADYQIALARARAELADAQAAAVAADGMFRSRPRPQLETWRRRVAGWKRRRPASRRPRTAWETQARLEDRTGAGLRRQQERRTAGDTRRRAARGVDGKDEISQQQFDAAVAAADGLARPRPRAIAGAEEDSWRSTWPRAARRRRGQDTSGRWPICAWLTCASR